MGSLRPITYPRCRSTKTRLETPSKSPVKRPVAIQISRVQTRNSDLAGNAYEKRKPRGRARECTVLFRADISLNARTFEQLAELGQRLLHLFRGLAELALGDGDRVAAQRSRVQTERGQALDGGGHAVQRRSLRVRRHARLQHNVVAAVRSLVRPRRTSVAVDIETNRV